MLGRFSMPILKRFYVKPREVARLTQMKMIWEIPSLINLKQHKEFLLANEHQLPPHIIAFDLGTIAYLDCPRDEHWPEIVQLLKRHIKTFDRNVANMLGLIGKSMGDLEEANEEFWEIMETKLVKENLSRYLTEADAANLMLSLYKVGRGSDELWQRLENEVSMHYLALKPELLKTAIFALEVSSKGKKETIEKLKGYLDECEQQLQITA
ncbi:unnamed protein product [Blepharisma stoltei]|uniref:Uncharacterized protein n=1 Tax=Blepharisma stoltei TaxID=1481888 RepID=A0AAU9I9H4_9CILI|nr:unnamed protein product [Blepharisma stoltei]